MFAEAIRFGLVKFLHDLFTAVWTGGLIALALSVLPAARASLRPGPQTKKLMTAIQGRQSTLIYISIVGLLLTGLLRARRSPEFLGLLAVGNAYSAAMAIKHILVLAMIGVALYRSLILGRKPTPLTQPQEKLNAGLLLANAALGVAVLLVSGIVAGLATPQLSF